MPKIRSFYLLFALSFASAQATSFYIRPFSEFTQTTPNIVRGVVSNVHTEKSVDLQGNTMIYTYGNVEVREILKGTIRETNILIRKMGGTKDGITLKVPSSPEFNDGDDAVLFLSERRSDESYEVAGLELGKFGLVLENGKERLVGGIFEYSTPHAHSDDDEQNHEEHVYAQNLDENQREWTLTDLRNTIRDQGTTPEKSTPTTTTTVKNGNPNMTLGDKTLTPEPGADTQNKDAAQNKMSVESPPDSNNLWTSSAAKTAAVILLILGAIFLFLRRR